MKKKSKDEFSCLPLVSVIIPTYKRPEQLYRTVDSVLRQTYKNIEVIVIDDNGLNSNYHVETKKTIEKFFNGKNVIYISHKDNQGGSRARNTGWKSAKGKYITFLDDDDEIMPTKIEKQVLCLESLDEKWGACYTGYRIVKGNGKCQISNEHKSGNVYINALMRTMYMGSGSNLLLRKSVVDHINGYDESFIRNQDIEFLVRVTKEFKLAYIDEILLEIHQDGVRQQRSFEEIDGYAKYYLKVFEKDINELNDHDRERVIAVISLERFRVALCNKKIIQGIEILKNNRVSSKYGIRYLRYILRRVLMKESYGFDGC